MVGMSTVAKKETSRPRAFAYVRMSTKEQEEGDSRRRQLELATIYAADKSLQLLTAFEGEPFEDVGLSAFTGEHLTSGKLGRFFQALRDGRTIRQGDYLLVESLDRVSRQAPMIAFRIFSEIIEGGVTLVTTSDRHEYKSGIDLGGMIQSIVVMSRSNEESERKKDRLTRTWTAKRQDTTAKKLTSLRPAWLDIAEWDHSGKTPLPNPVFVSEHQGS
jgi:DNA invertase Pin-like site-specific DNA recombinase